ERAREASVIRAPVDGQLTRLAVHGAGETVQAGQTVAEIAPASEPLVFEAMLSNSDIGRVKPGQRGLIKVDAYPYQRYGTLAPEVTWISPDTVTDPAGGRAYRVIVPPAAPAGSATRIPLRLGLTATAEIVVARRRMIELLLDTLRGGG